MRFGILSDCHLGITKFRKISNLQNAYCELNNKIFKNSIDILLQNNVEAIIIAGDIFDRPNPSVQSISVALKNLYGLKIPVYILGGNHDYSQKDNSLGYHPFDLLKTESVYPIYDGPKIFNLNDCDLTMLPYKHLNAESYKYIYRGKLREKDKCSILIIHGYVDLENNSDSQEYALPKEVASNYDLVIAGHVHIPQIIKTKSTSILTPGSLMPSSQANSQSLRPSVYIYDTINKDIKSIELKNSPKIYEIITNNANKELEKIGNQEFTNDIYFIKYNGSIQDIDEYLYQKANQNILNLSVQTNEINNQVSIKKLSKFWSFVKDSYPDYYDEFKNLLKLE